MAFRIAGSQLTGFCTILTYIFPIVYDIHHSAITNV